MKKQILKIFKSIDNWLSYYGFLSKTGVLLIGIGIFLTFISFALGIHVLMFIPSFVLSLFLYSLIDVYFAKKNISIFWQNINNEINLRILFKKNINYSFFKIAHQLKYDVSCLALSKNMTFDTKFRCDKYFLIIQGRLDIFRKIIRLPARPSPDISKITAKQDRLNKDFYFQIRPYKEGDDVSKIDIINTSKSNKIYIREHIDDIIKSKIKTTIITKLKIYIQSNLYLKKRTDLKKGVLLEWLLIFLGIFGIQLEWGDYLFLIIFLFSLFVIYITNQKYKLTLYPKKKMNFWMFTLFALFILESILTFDVVQSGIHFLVLVCILKHRFQRERRDAFTYIFLILFVFVALSFFALKIWFFFLFTIYLIIAVGLFSIYAGGEKKDEYKASFGRPKNKLSYLSMNFWIFVFTIILFFILPHGTRSSMNVQLIPKINNAKTGFSDEVNLNSVISIKKDFSKQFLIENATTEKIPEYRNYYWRGMRFYNFQNLTWYKSNSHFMYFDQMPIKSKFLMSLDVKYFPSDNDALFLPAAPIYTEGPKISFLINDLSIAQFTNKKNKTTNVKSHFLVDQNNKIIQSPPRSQVFGKTISPDTYVIFKEFIETIPKSIINDPNKISDFIKNEAGFSYSLDSPAKDLQSFLYDEKQGHCEYFATVLAVTLRYFGYRATFVNGFHGGEFNKLANTWIVRGEHAHSWVEILDKSNNWIILDPTPPSHLIENDFWFNNFDFLKKAILYYDLLEYKWYNYIVQFSIIDQSKLWNNLLKQTPIIVLSFLIIIMLLYFRKYYVKKIKPYLSLNPKQKFMYWLSKKSKYQFFILEKLKKQFPSLSKKTQKMIYGQNTNKKDLQKLKTKWKKLL